jgi:hypothetical protein
LQRGDVVVVELDGARSGGFEQRPRRHVRSHCPTGASFPIA